RAGRPLDFPNTELTVAPLAMSLSVSSQIAAQARYPPPRSATRREFRLDLVHQRMREAGFVQFGKVLENAGFPRLSASELCPTILQIDAPRLVDAIKKHEGMCAVRVKPYLVLVDRKGLVDSRQTFREITRQHERIGKAADPRDDITQILLPLRIALV